MRLFIVTCIMMIGFSFTNLHAALPKIEAAMIKKDYAQARDLASQVLKSNNDLSQLAEARYYFGLAQLRLGQFAAARNAFQIVMDAHPNQDIYDQAALGIAEEFYITGFYQYALDTVQQLLKNSPHSSFLSVIYLKIAGSDLKLSKWENANEYLNKVINEFPKSQEAYIAKQLLEEKQYFSVQIGAFLDKKRAINLIENLKVGGNDAYMIEIRATDGERFYRVRIGKMSSLKEAEELEQRITKLGYPALIYP